MERIIINNISKRFKIGFKKNQTGLARFVSLFSGREPKRTIWALKDISFKANEGEIIGIIGDNGSGKTTLLSIIAHIYKQDEGSIATNGKIVPLINLGAGMQWRLTAKENIYLCSSLLGLSQKEIEKRFDSIIEFAELEEFVNTKLHQFSMGMMQRLAFSIGIHCNPEILLLDEVFEVGDESFKKKSSEHIKKLANQGATILLVTHELDIIQKHCSGAILLDKGHLINQGSPSQIILQHQNATRNIQ